MQLHLRHQRRAQREPLRVVPPARRKQHGTGLVRRHAGPAPADELSHALPRGEGTEGSLMFPLILLYVVLTIIRPQDYVPGLDTVPILPVVLLLAFAAWLASRDKTFEAPQFVILPAFLLVLMISQVTNGWTGGALDELARFGPVVIAFFIFGAACTTQKRVRVAMAVFVACGAV